MANKGFTLIELMIVVAITAILLTIAVPNLSDWTRNASIAAAGESFQNGLRSALGEAMKRNATVEFALTNTTAIPANVSTATATADGSNWVVRTLLNEWIAGQNQSDAYPSVVVSGPSGVRFSGFGKITDLSNTALAANAVFRLSRTDSTRVVCVYVTPGAGIRSCDPSRSSPDPRACAPALTAVECAP